LVDFGIAKYESNAKKTSTQIIMGTPSYMSPEQIRNTASVTSQTDIYSIGVVLWEMVSGKTLYDTMKLTSPEIQTQILQNKLPKTRTKWDRIIEKCTEKELIKRYKNCEEIIRDIQLVDTSTVEDFSKNINNLEPKRSKKRRNILLVGLFLVCAFYIHYKNYPTFYSTTDESIVKPEIQNESFVDLDGNEYHTIKIGDQIWSKENFAGTTFRNGDPIRQAQTNREWELAGKNHEPVWCYNSNGKKTKKEYGKLYNWYAIADERGLAPEGFKIASFEDWDKLHNLIGRNNSSGMQIISGKNWDSKLIGDNKLGFSALPAGFRSESNNFSSIGYSAFWWTSTETNSDLAVGYTVKDSVLKTRSYYKFQGFSVRLIKLEKR
jgi:uncharacterized protein (TIGR02145 family)